MGEGETKNSDQGEYLHQARDVCLLLISSSFFLFSFMNKSKSVQYIKKHQVYLLGVCFDDWRRVASSLGTFTYALH